MLSDDEFVYLVTSAHEQRDVEFKPPGSRRDGYLFAQVTRAALGMANIRGGGTIIIGVAQDGSTFRPVGLDALDLATWSYDEIAARFARYADPWIDFELAIMEYDHRQFVVLQVREFNEIPVLCKDEYQTPAQRTVQSPRSTPPILRAGACYIRSRRKPETVELPTQTEMRELLDLAIKKGVKRFVDRARDAGLDLAGASTQAEPGGYERQLRDAEGS